jgi:hypothetical protein
MTWQRRFATSHDTLLVAPLLPPSRCHVAVHRARMGPRRGPWEAASATTDDDSDADRVEGSRHRATEWARLPPTSTTPPLLVLLALLSQIHWH